MIPPLSQLEAIPKVNFKQTLNLLPPPTTQKEKPKRKNSSIIKCTSINQYLTTKIKEKTQVNCFCTVKNQSNLSKKNLSISNLTKL